MKILLANKFYYGRGGDCIYTMNLEKILKAKGHDVAIFAMQYPENEDSEWSKYWPSNMSSIKAFTRPFGDKEVEQKFSVILNDFKPDVVHLNNIHTQLSPILAEIAHKKGIRVVWTLHDPKLVCPKHECTRNGRICTECFNHPMSVIKYNCMNKGGYIGSVIGYLESKKWSVSKMEKYCDCFISPSKFMMNLITSGGYDEKKFRVLCNFFDAKKCVDTVPEKKDHYIYVGRVSREKGVATLCEAASNLNHKLVVVGSGDLLDELKSKYGDKIEFKGQMSWKDFQPLLSSARFMVLPSEWAENNPLSVIESLTMGTPVLGANIGGIPELIDETTGAIFESGNVMDLKEKIEMMWGKDFDYQTIANKSYNRFSCNTYYENLMQIYNNQ